MFDKIEISPADIRHKEFKTSALGYNKSEIRDYLDILAEYFEEMYSQKLLNKNETPQINVLEDKSQAQVALEQIHKREELISRALIQAENARNEIIGNAQKEADSIVRDAELRAKKAIDETRHFLNLMKQEFVNLKENHRQFLIASHSQLKGQLSRLEQDNLFSKEAEEEVNSRFEEVSKIKTNANLTINENGKPKSEPAQSNIEVSKPKSEPAQSNIEVSKPKPEPVQSNVEVSKPKPEPVQSNVENDKPKPPVAETSKAIPEPTDTIEDEIILPIDVDNIFYDTASPAADILDTFVGASDPKVEAIDDIDAAIDPTEESTYTFNEVNSTNFELEDIFNKEEKPTVVQEDEEEDDDEPSFVFYP